MLSTQPIQPFFPEDRLTRDEAAKFLGLSPSTLAADTSRRNLSIPYYRVGGRIYYRRTELDQWLKLHRVSGGAA